MSRPMLVIAMLASLVLADEAITNGTFNGNLDGWTGWPTGSFFYSTTQKRSEPGSVRMNAAGATILQDLADLPACYTDIHKALSFWAGFAEEPYCRITAQIRYTDLTVSSRYFDAPTGEFQQFSFSRSDIDEGKVINGVSFSIPMEQQACYIDDVSMPYQVVPPRPTPTITSVDPDSGYLEQWLEMTIVGTGFTDGFTVVILDSWDFFIESVTYVSPTMLKVKLGVCQWARPGPHDVTVTTYKPGGGTVTLHDGFRILRDRGEVGGWDEVSQVPLEPNGGGRRQLGMRYGSWMVTGPERGTGDEVVYVAKAGRTTDFYKYTPLGDSGRWSYDEIAQIPLIEPDSDDVIPKKGCCGVYGDGAIYMTKGNNSQWFWRYDIAANRWDAKRPVPLGATQKAIKGGNDMVYVSSGADSGWIYLLKGYKNEFYRYNTATDQWDTTLPPAPYASKPAYDDGSFLVHDGDNSIYAHQAKYVTKSGNRDADHHYMFRFDLAQRQWDPDTLPGMPLKGLFPTGEKYKKSKDGGCGIWLDGRIYALKGGGTPNFYRCDPAQQTWEELDSVPFQGSAAKRKYPNSGCDLTYHSGTGTFLAAKGAGTYEFYRLFGPNLRRDAGLPVAGAQGRDPGLTPSLRVISGPIVASTARIELLGATRPAGTHVTVSVHDALGRCVVRRGERCAVPGEIRLDVSGLARGVYLVRADADNLSARTRIVVP